MKVGLKLTEGFCSVICPSHLLLFPPHAIFSHNHISISPVSLNPYIILLLTPFSSAPWHQLSPSISSIWIWSFSYSFTVIALPFLLQHFLLTVGKKGEGHARKSWHQPVTLSSLLPPSASPLNQITPPHVCTQNPISQSASLSTLAFWPLVFSVA